MMMHGTTSGGAVPIFISSYVLLASFVVYLGRGLKDPQRALEFVREWKDKIRERNRPFLLTVGIAAISDLWNKNHTDDPNILQEALQFGQEALEIEENPYTYCALQKVHRALGQDERADECIQRAKDLGKPCEDTGDKVRRIVNEWDDVN